MAPVKPMGLSNPKGSKPGVTGFVQEYNQTPPPTQDLNPDAVDDPDSLPPPQSTRPVKPVKAPRAAKVQKSRR